MNISHLDTRLCLFPVSIKFLLLYFQFRLQLPFRMYLFDASVSTVRVQTESSVISVAGRIIQAGNVSPYVLLCPYVLVSFDYNYLLYFKNVILVRKFENQLSH